jgi:hypothetical protein
MNCVLIRHKGAISDLDRRQASRGHTPVGFHPIARIQSIAYVLIYALQIQIHNT